MSMPSSNARRTPVSRTFTAEEATRTLPLVRRIVRDIIVAHARWRELVDRTEVTAAMRSPARPDPQAEAAEREINALAAEIAGFQRELTGLGIELKDPAIGLVDFPGYVDGRRVYFCWRLGEPAVEYWHELGAGFAGRRRVAPRLHGLPPAPR